MTDNTMLALILFSLTMSTTMAFVVPSPPLSSTKTTNSKSSTKLQAAAPILIIGPMIRKMREEQAKKNRPMAGFDESLQEAPGLRVGNNAWRWPSVWPYDETFFQREKETAAAAAAENNPGARLAGMTNMLTGMDSLPETTTAATDEVSEEEKFNPLEYWGEDVKDVTTDMDEEAIEKLRSHYSYYIKDGASIIEFGASEASYLPSEVRPSRHVGISASPSLMEQNPSLTERLVVNLNQVIPDQGVDSEVLNTLAAAADEDKFDVLIMANTVDFITNPREVYRTAWQLLKPGGIMMVAFTTNKNGKYNDKFSEAQTTMWRRFNDDQHMWICGSFFHFSAGEGWQDLRGFDISPNPTIDQQGPFANLLNQVTNNMYVVQARKAVPYTEIDPADPESSVASQMWMLPVMESRDKQLVAARLARIYQKTANKGEELLQGMKYLPAVYECLIKMDQFAFNFGIQSQLAADLVRNPKFVANDEQILALKQGLGLRTPSEEFWVPVGECTSQMTVEDKVSLLSHLVPHFGLNGQHQQQQTHAADGQTHQEEEHAAPSSHDAAPAADDDVLQTFVTGLKPTYSVIRSKCPELSEGDVQLLGSHLLASEVLEGASDRMEFAMWLEALTHDELMDILETSLRRVKKESQSDMEDYRQARQEELERLQEQQALMEEQIQQARENRTMVFNRETGKMELASKKK